MGPHQGLSEAGARKKTAHPNCLCGFGHLSATPPLNFPLHRLRKVLTPVALDIP